MEMKSNKPNILMIVTDQLRADCVGCYHEYPVKTPNIDSLAEAGMVFEQAYTPLPVCCPARQSMITTRRPEKHGGLWNWRFLGMGGLEPSSEFWPEQLKNMGYHNYYFGKWHVSPDYSPIDFGYEKYVDLGEYESYRQKVYGSTTYKNGWFGEIDKIPYQHSRTHWLAGLAINQLEEVAGKKEPWHIRIDFEEPHLPCRPSQEFYQMYTEEEIPEWSGFGDRFENKPYIQRQQLYNWETETMDWTEWRKVVARYYAIISQVDDAIGQVIAKLKEIGEWENTFIVFTSDHGDMCGSHGMMDKHYIMYDDVVHVPLIAVWPGKIPGGTRREEFVYQALDLGPTIMEMTGNKLENSAGRSLLPLLYGENQENWRDEIVSTYNGQQFGLYTQRMLRTRKWKYIWNNTDVDELYDLENDKGELHNLIYETDYQEILKDLRKHLYEILYSEGDELVKSSWMKDQLLGKTKKL